jgi:hypothetical protein
MAVTGEKLEDALEMALTSLAGVAASGTNEERISASRVLIEAVEMASVQLRKQQVLAKVLPLMDVVTRNLAGKLSEEDDWAPVLSLDPAAQGSVLLSLSKELS